MWEGFKVTVHHYLLNNHGTSLLQIIFQAYTVSFTMCYLLAVLPLKQYFCFPQEFN